MPALGTLIGFGVLAAGIVAMSAWFAISSRRLDRRLDYAGREFAIALVAAYKAGHRDGRGGTETTRPSSIPDWAWQRWDALSPEEQDAEIERRRRR